MLPFERVAVIGMGLIGSSLTRAVRARMPTVRLTVHDADPDVRERVRTLDFADDVTDTAGAAVIDADLVVLAVPVLAMLKVAAMIAADLPAGCVVSDTGSVKGSVLADLAEALPERIAIVPAHPVAGHREVGAGRRFRDAVRGPLVHPDAPPPAPTRWPSSACASSGRASARASRR